MPFTSPPPSLSSAATAAVLRSLPLLLHLYWLLAAGAVLFTILPWNIAPGFKAAVRLSAARGKTMEPPSSSSPSSDSLSKASASTTTRGARRSSRSRKATPSSSASSASPASSSSSASSPLGPFLTELTVPQGWFLHFYALGSVVATAVLGAALRGAEGGWSGRASTSPAVGPPSVAALCLLLLHVVRRWGECAWQARWPAGARMHFIAYVFGMSYYAVLPLSLLPAGAFSAAADAVVGGGETRDEGALAGAARGIVSWLGFPPSPPPLRHPASVARAAFSSLPLFPRKLGVAVFAAGTALQASSHAELAELQRRAAEAGEDYLPPTSADGRRSALSLCMCPHYLGEIVIYLGLAMVAAGVSGSGGGRGGRGGEGRGAAAAPSRSDGGAPSSGVLPLLALVWVTVNLVLASRETKKWYGFRFPRESSEERAALIPGVF